MMIHRKLKSMLAVMAVVAAFTACSNNDEEPIVDPGNSVDTVITGTLNESKTLTKDKNWVLKGYVYIPSGVTLTIEAGTTIKSDVEQKGALCVERGGKLIANGSATEPIVFTSGRAAGSRAPGDWGGIVLLGRARTNRTSTPVIEGGLDRPYGGTDDNDNSGSLRFVRIEYAGIAAFQNSEINALTLGGVGKGTVLENIQVIYGNDDAYEFFGGTVDAKNLVAFATADDDYDFDFGYTGRIQHAVALRDPEFVDEGDAGNGIESDNDNPYTGARPYTRPVLSNFTFVGPNNAANTAANHNFGNRWRRASRFAIRNSIMIGWQKGGFSIEQDSTAYGYLNGQSEFKNNLVHAIADPFRASSTGNQTLTAAMMEEMAIEDGCVKLASAEGVLQAPFNLTSPNFAAVSAAATSGVDFTGEFSTWFTPTTYKGAVATGNSWLQGWTRFPARGQ